MSNEKLIVISVIIVAAIGLGLGLYSLFAVQKTTASFVLPNHGIHWHPHMEIEIKGEKIVIPTNIGIGTQYSNSPYYDSMMDMTNMHTHDDTGVIHWEVMHAPRMEDVHLGNFFEVWGKTFNSNCIFDYCNGPEGMLKMFVNGKENKEFEKYVIKDGDDIVIRFG
ncbi:MAG: hypothetical protein HYW24_03745 [Candidatus Aenigmarchaeota archaeon]|nr:hypothetical protein [Candidatus Aenigmarchaeota archaeon]